MRADPDAEAARSRISAIRASRCFRSTHRPPASGVGMAAMRLSRSARLRYQSRATPEALSEATVVSPGQAAGSGGR